MRKKIFLLSVLLFAAFRMMAQMVSFTESSEVTPDAYVGYCDSVSTKLNKCFGGSMTIQGFNQNGIWITPTHIFAVYWDKDQRLTLARKPVSGTTWKRIRFPDLLDTLEYPDNHKTPSVAVSPQNGSIHLAFGMHGSNTANDTLNYRVSEANAATRPDSEFDGYLFEPTRDRLRSDDLLSNFAYPTFVVGNDNKLLLFWRIGGSGKGDTYLSEYNAGFGWSPKIKITKKEGIYSETGSIDRSAYWNDIKYRNGRLHLSWCWREESGGGNTTNHDLLYAYSDDNGQNWYNNAGTLVGNGGATIMNVNSPGELLGWSIKGFNMANNGGEAIDGANRVHTVSRFETTVGSGQPTYYHIWRETNGVWTKTKLNLPAIPRYGRPKIFADVNTNTVYIVGVVDQKITIYAAKQSESYQTWYQVFTGTNNYHNDINGLISGAGNLLYVYAHRRPATFSGTFAELQVLKFSLNPNASTSGLLLLSTTKFKEGEFGSTSLAEIPSPELKAMKIYPNPSESFLMIECAQEISSVELSDLNGRVLKTINGIRSKTYKMERGDVVPGIYTIRISSKGEYDSRQVLLK